MKCLDETEVVDLLEGRLTAGARDTIDAHLDRCAACRALVGAASDPSSDGDSPARAPVPAAPRAIGSRISRYQILGVVGSGGMGVVYAAYDPELGRKVAIKVLRRLDSADTDALRTRLLREAQSMARLTHPNVVAVHDVATVDGQVVIVMELVAGLTLGRWLEARPRSTQEILDVFRRAGQGLAAAHAVGLVHRDVKPENVLVGDDGRVLVTDFGLARSTGTLAPLPDGAAIADRLTRSGTLIGTPAYMAPEQLAGHEVSARSDVFGFCVALYEALYGERPFAGEQVSEVRDAIAGERVREPPRGARVPERIRRVLLRGMKADPQRRYASMNELLVELVRDPGRTRRRVALALAGVLVVAGASALVALRVQAGRERAALCQGGAAKLARAWNHERRAGIHKLLLASGKAFAPAAWTSLEHALDQYGQAWTAMYGDACQATRVRGEQSEDVMQLRMDCLANRLDELDALTALLAQPDAMNVETAARVGQSLSPLAACSDVESLRAPVRPPRDAATRARVADLMRRTAAIKASIDAGRYAAARPLALDLRAQAAGVAYPPLEAAVVLTLGKLQLELGELAAAEASFFDAARAAEAGHDDEQAARAWIEIVDVVGYGEDRLDEAQRWAGFADAAVRRLGGARPDLEAKLLDVLSGLAFRQNDMTKSLAQARRVLQLRERLFAPDSLEMMVAYQHLAIALQANQRDDEALGHYRRAMSIAEQHFGAEHPQMADAHFNLGTALNNTGHLDEAERELRRALAIGEASLPPTHLDLAWYTSQLAMLLAHTGRAGAALPLAERALAIRSAGLSPMHVDVGEMHLLLSDIFLRLERGRAALQHAKQAVTIFEHADPASTGYRGCEALGAALLLVGQKARALAVLERADRLAQTHKPEPLTRAYLDFTLARALVANHGDRARARTLALAARAAWAAHPARLYTSELTEVAAFLAHATPAR